MKPLTVSLTQSTATPAASWLTPCGRESHAILQLGEAQIEKSARTLIDAARNEADEKLSAELARLEALRAVNPNIRDDELTAIESNRQQVMESLDQAGWRLDALRLIVVTHQ